MTSIEEYADELVRDAIATARELVPVRETVRQFGWDTATMLRRANEAAFAIAEQRRAGKEKA